MTVISSTITAELMQHVDGRSIAYIDASAVAVFTYQQPNGTYVIDIRTRDDIASGRLCLLLDGQALPDGPGSHTTSDDTSPAAT
jgi:hypothetical protein